jgi:uncharacterized protein with GYD domain
MTEETGAAAPTDESALTAQTESEPATQPIEQPQAEAAPENAETKEDSPEAVQDDRPKKPSRTERMKRRMQAMATELDSLRAQMGEYERVKANPVEGPKEADYNGDYFAFQAAKTAHETKQALRAEFNEQKQAETQRKLAEKQAEMVQEFEERAEEFRERIPDFDKAINDFVKDGGKFSPTLVEELQASEMGPALAYQIVKNPQLAAQLNQLSPREVAREIGRLEGKVSLPNPNKITKAPPPLKTPAGAAANLKNDPSSMSMEEYVAWRKAGGGTKK